LCSGIKSIAGGTVGAVGADGAACAAGAGADSGMAATGKREALKSVIKRTKKENDFSK
jgi:hypothetical protein